MTEPSLRARVVVRAALDRGADERAVFLAEACADDEPLRVEVASLLASHEAAQGLRADRGATPEPAATAPTATQAAEATAGHEGLRLGPYRLLRELGHGGMGAVYLARRDDGEFRQSVAIKLIRRGLDSDEIVARFKRERQILASLDHPNIARLLDGGSAPDGTPYFVMEHIEGQPIHRYCAARGLDTRARLALFRRVCEAVGHAHRQLVVHRDLKPHNILVTDAGVPKLLDFGIAKLLSPALGRESVAPTAAAARAMTPYYASPEQVRGGTVSFASDIYSLGVVLHELLTGTLPYDFPSDDLVMVAWIVSERAPTPPSLALTRRTGEDARQLRGDLDTIVLKALAKEPARRYGSASELAEDVTRYLEGRPVRARRPTLAYRIAKAAGRHKVLGAVAAAAAIAASVGTATLLSRRASAPAALSSPSAAAAQHVAVLPFRQLGGTGDNVLGVGVAEAIASRLGRSRNLVVRPIGAVLAAAGQDPVAAGRRLGVARVVDGTVTRSAGRVQVTVQLVDVERGGVVWSGRMEEAESELFALQESAAQRIAGELLPIVLEPHSTHARLPRSAEVQELYLQARYHLHHRSLEDSRQAIVRLTQVVALDPSFAPGFSALARAQVFLYEYSAGSAAGSLERARTAAQRALELDPDLGEANMVLGLLSCISDWRWDEAAVRFRHAIEVDPGEASTYNYFGACLVGRGQFDEGIRQVEEAYARDPLSAASRNQRLRIRFMAGRFEEVVREATPVIEGDPTNGEPYAWRGLARVFLEDANAVADLEQAAALAPDNPQIQTALGFGYARSGKRERALELLERLTGHLPATSSSRYLLAEVEAGLGRVDRAVAGVLEAARRRAPYVALRLAVDPRMSEVRRDPRIVALLAELGLPEQPAR